MMVRTVEIGDSPVQAEGYPWWSWHVTDTLAAHDCSVDVQDNPKTLSVSVKLHWPYSAKRDELKSDTDGPRKLASPHIDGHMSMHLGGHKRGSSKLG